MSLVAGHMPHRLGVHTHFFHFIVCLVETDLAHNIDVCNAMNLLVLFWFYNFIAVPKSVPDLAGRMR